MAANQKKVGVQRKLKIVDRIKSTVRKVAITMHIRMRTVKVIVYPTKFHGI